MSDIKLKAASGGGSISLKGPSSAGSDTDFLAANGNLTVTGTSTLTGNVTASGNLVANGKVGIGNDASYASVDADDLIIGTTSGSSNHGLTILSPTNKNAGIYFSDGDNPNGAHRGYFDYNHTTDALNIGTAGTQKVVINSAGSISVPSGQGIDFSATGDGDGSMGNELLDDYEEGTWTAVLGGTSNHSSYNVTANTAYYTKIGRLVTLFFAFEGKDLNNSASGQLRISGVPYDPASGGGWTSNFTTYNVVFNTSKRPQLYISGPNIYGIESGNNSSWSDWQVSDFHNSNMYLRCNMTYHTS